MSFQFLEQCGIGGILSLFLGSLIVFGSLLLTYSFRQVGLKRYLLFHGLFALVSLIFSVIIYNLNTKPEAAFHCSMAPVKMLAWIPVVIASTLLLSFVMARLNKA